MTEDDARNLLLVRAVEIEDRDAKFLTSEDRTQATNAGLAASGDGDSRLADERFLAARSRFAATRLATRHPLVATIIARSRWPSWLGWALPLAALIAGVLTNEIGSGRRLNIIAFPLLGMFLWNLVVYLHLALATVGALVRRRPFADAAARPGWLARIATFGRGKLNGHDPLSRALARFLDDWTRASTRLAKMRAARILHVAAALFAIGVIAGIYARGLGVEYRAGWESTFLAAPTVHWLVTTLLAPAATLTGVPLPNLDRIAAIRWTGPVGGGENATPWIHLYAASAIGFIVVPRLLLAAGAALRGVRMRRRFAVPGREDFYVRRLLRGARGRTSEVRVTPYAYTPDPEVKRRLAAMLESALGEGTRVNFDPPVSYGAEDAWLGEATVSPATDHHLVLFNLGSTPESENHGAFVAGLEGRLREARTGTVLTALLDEGSYRQRLGAQHGAQERLAARTAAWRQALAPLAPVTLDLAAEPDGSDTASRLEAGLLNDPQLAAVR